MGADDRLFRWIHALWYPAILGTMIGVLLSQRPPSLTTLCWALVLIAYFAVQYGEGLDREDRYNIREFWFDVAEIVLIVAAFSILGLFSIWGESLPSLIEALRDGPAPILVEIGRRSILGGAFFLPVAARAMRGEIRKEVLKTVLSCLATGVILLFGAGLVSAAFVAILLMIHVGALFKLSSRHAQSGL